MESKSEEIRKYSNNYQGGFFMLCKKLRRRIAELESKLDEYEFF